MANEDDWIESTDNELIASIIKHEGDKAVIYSNIKSGNLKAAENCDADACMENDAWPAICWHISF